MYEEDTEHWTAGRLASDLPDNIKRWVVQFCP